VPPYTLFVVFKPQETTTDVFIRIKRPSDRFALYDEKCTLGGKDWASGVLVFKTSPRRRPFRVALGRIVVSGTLSSERIEEVPWQG
jgi:hypothetical protein